MNVFKKESTVIKYITPDKKFILSGVVTLLFSVVIKLISNFIGIIPDNVFISLDKLSSISNGFNFSSIIIFVLGIILIVVGIILCFKLPETVRIACMVKKSLFIYEYGNPLRLKENEALPSVKCKSVGNGIFTITISAVSSSVEELEKISSNISSCLNKKHKQYAVTQTTTDLAFNEVVFKIEDVTIDRSLYIDNVEDLKPDEPTKLIVADGTHIDLTTSGSILVAGKTRSGKTTGIISILTQILLMGRDNYNSKICIIDPKQAELSRLPHVVSLDENGEATEILNAIKDFATTIVKRQKVLNALSVQHGDAVKWWDAGFKPSFLFVDEYVACRTLFPKKASKTTPDYSLSNFDSLIKRIVTMGASAGCFCIISIAEASVEEGGLPSMIKSAMTTKLLFKPTLTEGRLIWSSEKLKDFNTGRVYNAGDAWFSSTDGIHDDVSFVHFPVMRFKVYKELGRLLNDYYK